MNGTMNNNLKIIKARVEQDKYAAVELKIIKANGVQVIKDLYVEKEMNNGELYVASDNVLVTLHRALRNGEFANLQLISLSGDVLMNPEFSEINQVENNLFIGVKAVSNMISIKNNQALKTDPLKVQEIAADSKNIKEQMISTMRTNNPNTNRELRFVYEDAYNEACVYKIEKIDGKYVAKIVGDKASFIATDGINVYSHSNIVADITKVEKVGEEEVVVKNIGREDIPIFNFGKIDQSVSMYDQYAPKSMPSVEVKPTVPHISEVDVDQVVLPIEENVHMQSATPDSFSNIQSDISDIQTDSQPNIQSNIQTTESNLNSGSSLFGNSDTNVFVKDSVEVTPVINDSDVSLDAQNQSIDNFFEDTNDFVDEKSFSVQVDDFSSTTDKYEQLGEMISKLIQEQKDARKKIVNYKSKMSEMEERLSKANQEIENKTSKVNVLINQNRQIGDENRSLKGKMDEFESKIKRLEQSNQKYIRENDRLRAEATKGNAKLNGIISSVSELLGSYGDIDGAYSKQNIS